MRQIDKPTTENTNYGSPVNREEAAQPKPRIVSSGVKELEGRMFTELEANAKAPSDYPKLVP